MSRSRHSRHWCTGALFKLAISAGLLVWLLRSIDITQLLTVLAAIPFQRLAMATCMILLQLPVLTHRWYAILGVLGEKPRWSQILRLTYLGIFFNQVLPGAVGGDVVRILQLHRSGASLRVATNSVLLERVTGLYALVMLLVFMSPLIWPKFPDHGVVIGALVLAVLVTTGFIALAFADRLTPSWRRLEPLVRPVMTLRQDYCALLSNWRGAVSLLLLGVVSWLLNLIAIYIVAEGVGVDIPIAICLFLAGLSVLVSVMPVSLAGWGVREGAMVVLFGLMGVPVELAASVSVSIGLLMLLAALPASLLFVKFHSTRRT